MSKELSQTAQVKVLPTADIGGTNAAAVDAANWGAWHSMRDFDRVTAIARLGTWNATDDLDTCKLQQAQDASGTGAKDLTTSASGGDYDTDAPVDAEGDEVILEARAQDLDRDNGFTHVRLYVAETGDTGVDNVAGVLILHGAGYPAENLHRAAVAASVVYVRPS
jgi:hypothetical protein